MEHDLSSLEPDITVMENALARFRSAASRDASPAMWADALEMLDDCREELVVAEAQIRFHRLEAAAWRAGEYRTSPWTSRVLDRLPVPVMSLTDTGVVTYANPAAARMIGVSRAALMGKPLAVHVDLDHRLAFRAAWTRALREDAGASVDVVLRTRHGAATWRRLVVVSEADGSRVRVTALPVESPLESTAGSGEVDVPRALAAVAALPSLVDDEDRLLEQALALAVEIDGVVAASWSAVEGRTVLPASASSASGYAVEALQGSVAEGPGHAAAASRRTVTSEDLAHDGRWPRFGALASELGYRAVVTVPVTVHGDPAVGAGHAVVSLWGPSVGSLPGGPAPVAGAVADTIAAAVGVRRRMGAVLAEVTRTMAAAG